MSVTFSNAGNTFSNRAPLAMGAIVRRFAWWSGAATGAIVTNTALLFALLYWFSVFE